MYHNEEEVTSSYNMVIFINFTFIFFVFAMFKYIKTGVQSGFICDKMKSIIHYQL